MFIKIWIFLTFVFTCSLFLCQFQFKALSFSLYDDKNRITLKNTDEQIFHGEKLISLPSSWTLDHISWPYEWIHTSRIWERRIFATFILHIKRNQTCFLFIAGENDSLLKWPWKSSWNGRATLLNPKWLGGSELTYDIKHILTFPNWGMTWYFYKTVKQSFRINTYISKKTFLKILCIVYKSL